MNMKYMYIKSINCLIHGQCTCSLFNYCQPNDLNLFLDLYLFSKDNKIRFLLFCNLCEKFGYCQEVEDLRTPCHSVLHEYHDQLPWQVLCEGFPRKVK